MIDVQERWLIGGATNGMETKVLLSTLPASGPGDITAESGSDAHSIFKRVGEEKLRPGDSSEPHGRPYSSLYSRAKKGGGDNRGLSVPKNSLCPCSFYS